jgi:hypothetical protein
MRPPEDNEKANAYSGLTPTNKISASISLAECATLAASPQGQAKARSALQKIL